MSVLSTVHQADRRKEACREGRRSRTTGKLASQQSPTRRAALSRSSDVLTARLTVDKQGEHDVTRFARSF